MTRRKAAAADVRSDMSIGDIATDDPVVSPHTANPDPLTQPNCDPVGKIHHWHSTGIQGANGELEVCCRCGRIRFIAKAGKADSQGIGVNGCYEGGSFVVAAKDAIRGVSHG